MYAEKRLGSFSGSEVGLALAVGLVFEAAFFVLLVWAGKNNAHIQEKQEIAPIAIPINVKPMMDDLPLLKLGSKNPVKPKLPDMWKKATPTPVRRLEERSAPSETAKDDVKEIPKSQIADKDHKAPTKDDEIVEKADEPVKTDAPPEKLPESTEQGSPDGSAEGTETDPLKARAVNLYKAKLVAWFNARFKQPTDIDCEVLKKLKTNIRVNVSPDRAIAGFSLTKSSGNAVFDGKVSSFVAGVGGQILPPPPPLYPDILSSTINVVIPGLCATPE